MDSATNTTTQATPATPAPTPAPTPPTRMAITPKIIRVTEGAMKANLATDMSGVHTLGLSSVSTWRDSLPILKKIEPTQVLIAFDADARTNRVVAGHLNQYFHALSHNGIEAALEVWDAADGKGIDDLLNAGKHPTVIAGDAVERVLAEILAAANEADPTPETKAINEARQTLAAYGEAVKKDNAAAFDEPFIHALILLRERALIEYQRIKRSVLKPHSLIRDVEQAMRAVVDRRAAEAAKARVAVKVVDLNGEAIDSDGEGGTQSARHQNLVRSRVIDAPVPENAIVPRGWILDGGGVRLSPAHPDAPVEMVLPSPAVIEQRFHDINTGLESVRLAWYRSGRWYRHVEDRGVISNSRKIIDLASQGLPVTSFTAGNLSRYLVDFEETNIDVLTESIVTSQLGWQGRDGEHGFLLGKDFVQWRDGEDGVEGNNEGEGEGENIEEGNITGDIPPIPEEQPSYIPTVAKTIRKGASAPIEFLARDGGDEQIAAGFCTAGSLSGWLSAIAPLVAYPRALLALYASFAAPLVQVLGAPNFIVDLSSTTSRGKTVTLRAAASVWGNPDETAENTCLYTWDATRVRIERTAAIVKNLPLILDDTKRARHPKQIAQTLYDFASGQGRGRGSLKGVCERHHWRTVMLSTGEQPIYSFTEDGGTRGRVVESWSAHGPFGGVSAETATMVNLLDAGVRQHYGYAGRTYIESLQSRRDIWGDLREGYREQQQQYIERAGDNAIAIRLSAFFAVIDLAAALAHASLEMPFAYHDPIEALWDELIGETVEADRADAAMAHVMSWANANETAFHGRAPLDSGGVSKSPPGGMAGRWDRHEWDFIAFYPHKLREILAAAGHDSEGILRTWRDRGYIKSKEKTLTCAVRVDGECKKMTYIYRNSTMENENDSDDVVELWS